MSRTQKCILEMIHELGRLTVSEIQEARAEWLTELEAAAVPEWITALCSEMCRLVIEKKRTACE